MALGLPQWLPLTDAEEMIATHLAAEVDALAEDELLDGEMCKIPGPGSMSGLNGNGRVPAPEMELDLDCWQVQASSPIGSLFPDPKSIATVVRIHRALP